MKLQVWAGEFIELQALLLGKQLDTISLKLADDDGAPSLQLVSKPKSAPLALAQWVKAWNRFVALMAQKSPQVTVSLAHHMETVLNLAEKKADWTTYDTNLRTVASSIPMSPTHAQPAEDYAALSATTRPRPVLSEQQWQQLQHQQP